MTAPPNRCIVRVCATLALPFFLTGCFRSDQPLIAESESVAPVAAGKYIYYDTDETSEGVIVAVQGGVTEVTFSGGTSANDTARLLMRKLDQDDYIVMDEEPEYDLIRLTPTGISQFDASALCKQLESLAKSKGRNLRDYGVDRFSGEEPPTCFFGTYENLANAFRALRDANLLKVNRTYRPAP